MRRDVEDFRRGLNPIKKVLLYHKCASSVQHGRRTVKFLPERDEILRQRRQDGTSNLGRKKCGVLDNLFTENCMPPGQERTYQESSVLLRQ